jgi:HlyD family secretion protein
MQSEIGVVMRRFFKIMAIVILLGGLVAGAAWSFIHRTTTPQATFQMTLIKRGDLVSTISATGTLEPEELIDVGAQVAGQIIAFGKDEKGRTIDYGSRVKAGTILAKIDDSLYASDVAEAKAALVQAQANVQRAEADLEQYRAKLDQAEQDWHRAQELGPSNALAQTSYDAYKAGYETAQANLAVGEATVAQNKGAVVQAQAALDRAQRNLGYCTIVSPVNGVIIDRRVNIGQTVVSSLNAPSLFLIAKDLRHMQIWIPVNEADIANIHSGQPVSFTVDALPGHTFRGKVAKVRLNASMTQNVVTYTVVVSVNNSSLKLLPYLTANVQFQIANRPDVLMVSTGALRWSPSQNLIAPQYREGFRGNKRKSARSAGASPAAISPAGNTQGEQGTLWVKTMDGLRPMPVRTGLSNNLMTEISGKGVRDGLAVVEGEIESASSSSETDTNPFMPQIGHGGRSQRESH